MPGFPFQFHAYGFVVGLGVVVSVWIVEWIVNRETLKLQLNQLILTTVLGGIIGARVYHLITDWQLYTNATLFQLIAIWNGGLGFIGALIGGSLGLWVGLFLQKKQQSVFALVDSIVLSLPFAQGIGRWGNFFNQELYGKATSLPWGLTIAPEHLLPGLDPSRRYHPLFLYESIQLLVFGTIMLFVYKSGKASKVGSGIYTGLYCIFYAGVRFSLEFLRIESARPSSVGLQVLTTAQWMMMVLFFIGVSFTIRSFRYATQ